MKKELNVVGKRKVFMIISACLIAATIVCSLIFGVEIDIQFKGGAIITYSYTGDLDKAKVEDTAEKVLNTSVNVQTQTDIATKSENVVISLAGTKALTSDQQANLTDTLQKDYKDNNLQMVNIKNVDPTMGQEFFFKCLIAVGVAFLLMIIYIAFRFRKIGGWSAGVMGVIALLHDAIMVFATFVIFRIPLNDSFMAVILTILGYSINDTIVIYDRIRENEKITGGKQPIGQLVNSSINQTFGRTINTSVATIMAMVVVCIVALIFNVQSILTFAFPMIIGMISGVYSSICLSGPLWVMWQEHKLKKGKGKKNK